MPLGDKQLWALDQAAGVLQSSRPAPAPVPAEPGTWGGPAWLAEGWDGAARDLQHSSAPNSQVHCGCDLNLVPLVIN